MERGGIGYVRQNFWPLRDFLDLHDVNRQARVARSPPTGDCTVKRESVPSIVSSPTPFDVCRPSHRFRRRVTRFERRDLALHFPAGHAIDDSARRNLVDDRELIRIGRATLCLPRLCPQSRSKVIMDSAAGHLDGTFVREYLGDLPIRPTPAREAPQ